MTWNTRDEYLWRSFKDLTIDVGIFLQTISFLQIKLSRRYQVKTDVPTLILLDGSNGTVLTRGGVDRIISDPTGANFPWRRPHPKAALEDGPLLPCGASDSNEPMLHEELRHCFKGIYFSAHWVHMCLFHN